MDSPTRDSLAFLPSGVNYSIPSFVLYGSISTCLFIIIYLSIRFFIHRHNMPVLPKAPPCASAFLGRVGSGSASVPRAPSDPRVEASSWAPPWYSSMTKTLANDPPGLSTTVALASATIAMGSGGLGGDGWRPRILGCLGLTQDIIEVDGRRTVVPTRSHAPSHEDSKEHETGNAAKAIPNPVAPHRNFWNTRGPPPITIKEKKFSTKFLYHTSF